MKQDENERKLCDACIIDRVGDLLRPDEVLRISKRLTDLVQRRTIKDQNSGRCAACCDFVGSIQVVDSGALTNVTQKVEESKGE